MTRPTRPRTSTWRWTPAVCAADEILAVIDESPIAATTLALLLRGSEGRSVAAGLVAESATYSVLQAGPEFRRWRDARPKRARPPEPGPPVVGDGKR